MKKVFEKIISGIITCSGFLTSVVILLIVVFLFSEGLGLFSQKTIEEGYTLVVNKSNPVEELNAKQIKEVFDEDVTNWEEVGGKPGPIMVFRFEDMQKYFSEEELGPNYENATACINSLVEKNPGIVAFVPEEFAGDDGFSGKRLKDHTISAGEVFGGNEWFPTATPAAQFGFMPLILGTVWVTVFAILFALPFGLSVAIYMSEVSSARMRAILKPVIELLNGIPSVVYGLVGMLVLVPGIRKLFHVSDGASLLAAIIVLAIMILPSIIKVSVTALEAVPKEYEDASLALGATPVETYLRVSVPAAKSGIAAAVVLGVGRAIGEAMAVMMVSGNACNMPSLFESVRFLTTAVASEMSYSSGLQRQALFSIALVLFLFIMLLNATLNFFLKRNKEG